MPSKCMFIALIFIYDISSALLRPTIAMKVILDPNMCEI